jgi:hypothetical protein
MQSLLAVRMPKLSLPIRKTTLLRPLGYGSLYARLVPDLLYCVTRKVMWRKTQW